jgi:hypothetical protein
MYIDPRLRAQLSEQDYLANKWKKAPLFKAGLITI